MAPTATGMLMISLTHSVSAKLNFQFPEFQALSLLPRMFFLELFERLAPFHISGLILEVTNPDSNYMTFWKSKTGETVKRLLITRVWWGGEW